MYEVKVRIVGTAPILQHKFGAVALDSLMQGQKKKTGSTDYSKEWLETAYFSAEGFVFQPATHIEGSMVKAASSFTISGKGKKTWKDAVRGYVYVSPDEVPLLWRGECIPVPDDSLLLEPTEALSVSVMRVTVNRAAVARSRLQVAAGWELAFQISVTDDQVRPDVLENILVEAGRAIGIGDFRPRYGRFHLQEFTVIR